MPRKNHAEFEDGDSTLYDRPSPHNAGKDQKTTKTTDTPSVRHHPVPNGITDSNSGNHGKAVGFVGLGAATASEDTPGSL